MATKCLTSADQNDQGAVFAVISAAGCADVDVRPANAPKPKSYITADPD